MLKKLLAIVFVLKISFSFSQSGKAKIDSLENVLRTSKEESVIIETKSALFINQFLSGQEKKAMNHYSEALALTKKLNYKKGYLTLYNNYGTYLYNKNEFDSALLYFTNTNKLARELKDKNFTLRSLNNMASVKYMKGDNKSAIGDYNEGLQLEHELGLKEGSVISFNNIGFLYNSLAMYDKAYGYFKKAEKLGNENNSASSLVYSYDGLSMTFVKLKNTDSAIYYAKKSLELGRKLNDLYTVGYSLDNLGSLYKNLKNYQEALGYYKEATTVFEKINDYRLGMTIYANLSDLYFIFKDTINANLCVEKMMQLNRKFQVTLDRNSYYHLFADISYRKKEYKQAYDYLKAYTGLRDSMYSIDVAQQINEINTKFETDRKEKQNLILQKDNEKRVQELNNQKTVRNYLVAIIIFGVLVFIGAIAMFRKINRINAQLSVKNKDIEEKNHTLTEQKKEILDSIHYAKKIQHALLANHEFINQHIAQNFILFKPKDIVSGDFYWATTVNSTGGNFFYLAVCDSTGHGVPGAFMSLLNIGFLSEAINEKGILDPGQIFDYVRQRLINSISKEGQKDGFDGILLCVNQNTGAMSYAAANNAPIVIKGNEILSLPYNKMPVGMGIRDENFETHSIKLNKEETLYLYTDGYADQFGGPKGKKFKYKQLNELLTTNHLKPLHEQQEILNEAFENWKGNLEQVDDVCVIGIRV